MTALKDVERSDETLREEALERLTKRQDLRAHLLLYAMVMTLLWTIWLLTMPGGFPWPAIVMFGWGIGVVMNVWDVYARKAFTEADVQEEIERLRGPRPS
jgi:2TM domain